MKTVFLFESRHVTLTVAAGQEGPRSCSLSPGYRRSVHSPYMFMAAAMTHLLINLKILTGNHLSSHGQPDSSPIQLMPETASLSSVCPVRTEDSEGSQSSGCGTLCCCPCGADRIFQLPGTEDSREG
ncbi:hypothetical protein EYF80_012995 [Liparis tanakae]|uniref:Uncharacterized protein n=1 Tax=Liparis tanakae TaxID=230148 RepID=A0A4Z2IFK2_9TELE|nr:hypothetical protein EYF80_012995 [Liparis tanakae]